MKFTVTKYKTKGNAKSHEIYRKGITSLPQSVMVYMHFLTNECEIVDNSSLLLYALTDK